MAGSGGGTRRSSAQGWTSSVALQVEECVNEEATIEEVICDKLSLTTSEDIEFD